MKLLARNLTNKQKTTIGIALIILLSVVYALIVRSTTPRVTHHVRMVYRKKLQKADRYWKRAKEVDYKSVPELLAQHKAELERGVRHDILMRGPVSQRQVALTFDDGPHPLFTKRILTILDEYNVKATFFLVGEMAERYPALVRAEVADGHSIGNHTYHHVNVTKIPTGYIATEIGACDEVLESITGKSVHLFRPPGGDYNDNVAEVCEALNHTMVLWTDDPGDYADPGVGVIDQRVLETVSNGGIILIHDGVQQTIDTLPYILQVLKDRGYQFVTIDEMLKEQGDKH
ncbi:MAG: polysaccharide deacetylase family protein [Armatimonadota bacterium]